MSFRHKGGTTANFLTWGQNVISRKYIQLEDPGINDQGSSSTQLLFFHHAGEDPRTHVYPHF